MTSCPSVNGFDLGLLETTAPLLAQSMGSESCKTSASGLEGRVNIRQNVSVFNEALGSAKTENQQAWNKYGSTTVGCEQIAINVQKNVNIREKMKCMISKSGSTIDQSVHLVNVINIEFGEKSNIELDGDFDIRQEGIIKVKAYNSITDNEKIDITQSIQDSVTSLVENIAKSDQGFAATPQGQKIANELLTVSKSSDVFNNIKDNLDKTLQTLCAQNNIVLKMNGRLKARSFKVTQNTIFDIEANNSVIKGLQYVMDSKEVTDVVAKFNNELEAYNKGGKGFSPADFQPSDIFKDKKGIFYTIGVIVVIIIVLIILYYLFKYFMTNRSVGNKTVNNKSLSTMSKPNSTISTPSATMSKPSSTMVEIPVKQSNLKFRYRYRY
jgi:hypothetical protein